MSRATDDVLAERVRQVEEEGWTPAHDDTHTDGSLARAGAGYAWLGGLSDEERRTAMALPAVRDRGRVFFSVFPFIWPSNWYWEPKMKDRRRDLVRGAALIIAEIERLDRIEEKRSAHGYEVPKDDDR